MIAEFHSGYSALLFNSGYMANLSLLSSLPQLCHIVLYDALVHNSVKEGLHLSRARMKVIVNSITGGGSSVCICLIGAVSLRIWEKICCHVNIFLAFVLIFFCFGSYAWMALAIPTQ